MEGESICALWIFALAFGMCDPDTQERNQARRAIAEPTEGVGFQPLHTNRARECRRQQRSPLPTEVLGRTPNRQTRHATIPQQPSIQLHGLDL